MATSANGLDWAKSNRWLIPIEEGDWYSTPSVLRTPDGNLCLEQDLWHLVFSSKDHKLHHATSPDGLQWTHDPRSPIYPKAFAPCLLRVGDEIWMYYTFDTEAKNLKLQPWEIHLATGPNIHSLKPSPHNPVLVHSQPWEGYRLFYPFVVRDGRRWVMAYAAYWKPFTLEHWITSAAIGMAVSDDGIHWEKLANNPVLVPTQGSDYDATFASQPCLLRESDHWRLYYASRINQRWKSHAIALATKAGPLID